MSYWVRVAICSIGFLVHYRLGWARGYLAKEQEVDTVIASLREAQNIIHKHDHHYIDDDERTV